MKKKTLKDLEIAHNHLVRFSEKLQVIDDADLSSNEIRKLKDKTNDLLISFADFKIRVFKGSPGAE